MQAASPTTLPAAPRRWYARRVIVATLIVLLVAVGFYLLYRFSNVLFVLFVAAVFATAIRPNVLWMERHHIPQPLGILLMYALVGLVTAGVLRLLTPLLITQATTLSTDLPTYYANFREWLGSAPVFLIRRLAAQLPPELSLSLGPAPQDSDKVAAVAQAVAIVRGVGWSMFGLVAIGLISYFWIVDREQIVRAALLVVPLDQRDTAHEIWDVLEEKVGAFVRGQALLCVSIGILSAIAFIGIGVPNAVLLAVLAGVLEAVPYIGPIATAVLAISITLAQSPEKIWWVIGACILIQQVENAVLVPRIMDRTVGVNAVVTLLAIAAFGTLLGVSGAIMAIPLAVIIQVLVERLLFDAPAPPAAEIIGRDQIALLRYQAQDLANDLRERIREHDDTEDDYILEEDLEAVVGEVDQLLQTIRQPEAPEATGQPA
ncbi:MAG TPA: AI-2E family transporter [Herpetosiphonaceae bacterium]